MIITILLDKEPGAVTRASQGDLCNGLEQNGDSSLTFWHQRKCRSATMNLFKDQLTQVCHYVINAANIKATEPHECTVTHLHAVTYALSHRETDKPTEMQSQVHELLHISSCFIYLPASFLSVSSLSLLSTSVWGAVAFVSSTPQAALWSCEKQPLASCLCVRVSTAYACVCLIAFFVQLCACRLKMFLRAHFLCVTVLSKEELEHLFGTSHIPL